MSVFDHLRAPFPPSLISWRVGSTNADKTKGMALAYIDARDVMERLDEIIGPENWQCKYSHTATKTVCDIGIRFDGEWIWKADGAGDTDFEADKGALSDAFKRAAVRWGIGRYLYDLRSPWVAIEARGKSFIIKDTEYKLLDGLLAKHPSPSEAQAMAREATKGSGNDPDLEKRARQAYAEINKAATSVTLEALIADTKDLRAKVQKYDENIGRSFDVLIEKKRAALSQGKAA
jgi:hypothetical protein